MPITQELSTPGPGTNMSSNGSEPNGLYEPRSEQAQGLDLLELGGMLKRRWKVILLSGCVPAVVIFLMTKFVLTPQWAALASLRPLSKQSQMAAFMSLAGGGVLGSLGAASLLEISPESVEAQEYTSILESYDFTSNLLRQHHLAEYLSIDRSHWYSPSRWRRWLTRLINSLSSSGKLNQGKGWKLYEAMQDRFHCEFNLDTGNMDLRFLDVDPVMTQKILDWYISDLQAVLRSQEMRSTRSAMDSLSAAAAGTADPYLRSDLYQLAAIQVENLKMAEAQSDFAFKVIQSPVVPDRPYSPRPSLDGALAGVGGLISAVLWILVAASMRQGEIGGALLLGEADRAGFGETAADTQSGNRPVPEARLAHGKEPTGLGDR